MIILVEATTGVVLALRAVTFSPEASRAIHKAMATQFTTPFDWTKHQKCADSLTQGFDTEQLWAKCSIRCHGGD